MTCPNCTHPRATLPNGSTTCTWSEHWRMHCEAMEVCRMPTIFERREYLMKIQQRRGQEAWLQLRSAVQQVWNSSAGPPEVSKNTGS